MQKNNTRSIVIALICLTLCSQVASTNTLAFPVIGILTTIDNRFHDRERFFELSAFSFVPKSVTNWIEQTGAMPVLIPFDSEIQTLDFLLENVQGLIIQNGKTAYLNSKGNPTIYQQRITHCLNKAVEINQRGKYYPVIVEGWGMEGFVNAFSGNNASLLSDVNNEKRSNSIETTYYFRNSHFFKNLDSQTYSKVFQNKLLYFSLVKGYSPLALQRNGTLMSKVMVTGTSKDKDGKEFVSMMEHKQYPILATAFLTGRTQFERHGPNVFLFRDENVIQFSFDFMMSIVNKLRSTAVKIDRLDGEVRAYFSIYYIPERGAWDELEQVYLFNRLLLEPGTPMTFNEALRNAAHNAADAD
jgi:hypothetical protein